MKTPILTLMAGLLLALLGACHSTPSLVTATGMPYEVVVVAPPSKFSLAQRTESFIKLIIFTFIDIQPFFASRGTHP